MKADEGHCFFVGFRKLKKRLGYLFLTITTLGAWGLVVLAFTWVLGAVGWYLLIYLWRKDLILPTAIYSTAIAFIASIIWAIFIWSVMFLWSHYHYYNYYKKNRRKLDFPALEAPQLTWKEIVLVSKDAEKVITNMNSGLVENSYIFGETISSKNTEMDQNYLFKPTFYSIVIPKDFYDFKGDIVVAKGEKLTLEIIERIVIAGIYGEFVCEIAEYISKRSKSK